jgi:prenyltransferase beta subunit
VSRSVVQFLESRVSGERLFVETVEAEPTVEAARFGLETLDALGADLPGIRTAAAGFMAECRIQGAGYKDRRSAKRPVLNATYYAVRLLARGLVPGPVPDPQELVEWVRAQILKEGRVRPEMDVDELYYAVRAIQFALAPHEMRAEDKGAIVDFIFACRAAGGGFAFRPGGPGDIERTYCCVNMLETLDHEGGVAEHMGYIAACMAGGDVCWDPDRSTSTPATFYWGLRAASLSGTYAPWHEAGQRIETFRSEDGGYGAGGRSQLWHTYCCVNALGLVATHATPAEMQHADCV